jgi:hypothetical protein
MAHKKLRYRHEHIKLNKCLAISFKKSNKQQKSSCLNIYNIYAVHKPHIISRNLEPVYLYILCTGEVLQ